MTEWVAAHWMETTILAAFAGTTIIQISPLKINPWSCIARAIGRAINRDTVDSITDMQGAVTSMREALDEHVRVDEERHIKQCRMRILRFNDEILQGMPHTKEHYDETLDDITEYVRYCRIHPAFENSKADMAISNIESKYQQHLAAKTFL